MQNVTQDVTGVLKPFMLLAAYRGEQSSDYYIESHEIGSKGEVYAGKPLNHETVEGILKSFENISRKEKVVPSGRIPENLLYANPALEKYAWTVPSAKRFLYFSDTFIGNGEAYVPELLLISKANSLFVFAVKRTKESLVLCNAPFPNIYSGGSVCLGSAKVKKDYRTYQSMMDYWDKIFFGSEFTHLNHNGALVKGNINILWKEAIESGKPFDEEVLIESKIKLEELLK